MDIDNIDGFEVSLLDFPEDELACAMQQPSSADESSVTDSEQIKPFDWLSNFTDHNKDAIAQNDEVIPLIPGIPGSSRSEAVLLGSVRDEEVRANGGGFGAIGGGCYHFNMLSPVSVLESCATSSAGGGGSNGSVMSKNNNTKKNVAVMHHHQQQPSSVAATGAATTTRISKRGRPLMSSRRARSSSSASSYDQLESSDNECVPTESDVSEDEDEEDEEEELEEEDDDDMDEELLLDEDDDAVEQQSNHRKRKNRPAMKFKQQQYNGQNHPQNLQQQHRYIPKQAHARPHPVMPGGPRTVHVTRLPPQKKHRISGAAAATAAAAASLAKDGRRCSHCQNSKTPQWRAGPDGPKTLCNACGVRYKSGRLLPEYRPAGSPTFVPEIHSNSHRKVLEMRKRGGSCLGGGGGASSSESAPTNVAVELAGYVPSTTSSRILETGAPTIDRDVSIAAAPPMA